MKLKEQTRWRVRIDSEGEDSIKGKYGVIHQFEDGDLDIWVTNTFIMPRMERELNWKARNHYDDGGLFIRPFTDLDIACKYLRCPKKRHLAPERRLAATEHLAKLRLAKKTLVQSVLSDGTNAKGIKGP